MALYIPHSIFHLARLLNVRPVTFGPCYVGRIALLPVVIILVEYLRKTKKIISSVSVQI